jgi:hypothetical protein
LFNGNAVVLKFVGKLNGYGDWLKIGETVCPADEVIGHGIAASALSED